MGAKVGRTCLKLDKKYCCPKHLRKKITKTPKLQSLPPTSLSPILLPTKVAPAPAAILQMICCGCCTNHLCSTARCGCVTAQLTGTVFWGCHADEKCNNQWSKHVAGDTENANIDEEVDDETEIPEL